MASITANATHRSTVGAIRHRIARAVNKVFVSLAQRRTLRELSMLDDHQLADIGLRREQLTALHGCPVLAQQGWGTDALQHLAHHQKNKPTRKSRWAKFA